MKPISDITERVEFIECTLKNSALLLKLLYDVEDAKYVQEDISYASHNINEIYERYCGLADRVKTQQSIYNDMCKEKIKFQNKIEELEKKLSIVKDGKKIGMRNVALRVFKNKQPRDVVELSDTDKMLIIDIMNNNIE